MSRHHRIIGAAHFSEPRYIDGELVADRVWVPQTDSTVPFTDAEELARDAEEAEDAAVGAPARAERESELESLQAQVTDGTITHAGLVRLMQLG